MAHAEFGSAVTGWPLPPEWRLPLPPGAPEHLSVHLAGPERPLEVLLAGFDTAAFDSAAFAREGIQMPASVAGSVGKRQAEFFHGRQLARQALQQLGHGGVQIPIGPHRQPHWPPGVVGSISHTDGLVAALAVPLPPGAGAEAGVGVDVERILAPAAIAEVAASVLTMAERGRLQALAAPDWPLAFSLVFSAKESLFKSAFPAVGRYFDFSAAEVVGIDTRRALVQLRLATPLHPLFPLGRLCELPFRQLGESHVLTAFAA